jgi:diguanylate cyclase (GGDEF)-like protein
MTVTKAVGVADIVEWDNLGGRLPAQSVGELSHPARVVEPSLACMDLERVFLDDPALGSVLVDARGAGVRLISRTRFFATLIGRLGYGRALLVRRELADLPPVETLILEADTSLGGAAAAAATRAAECRFDDVVVRLADGALGTVSVANLFAELALARSFSALHDPLTGLPNRAFFLTRLAHIQAGESSTERQIAVLFVDVDDFKAVNDKQGHGAGDALLIAVGHRLRATLRAGSFLARFAGDEFAILLDGVNGEPDAVSAASRIVQAFAGDWSPAGHRIGVSVGVAMPTEATEVEALIDNADSAMYRAKRAGKATYALHSPELARAVQARVTLRDELRRAVEEQQFTVLYQPIVELDGLRMVSVEALVRWQHPSRGTVAPSDFIPAAEEMGLIVAIDAWVLDQALHQVSAWRLAYPELRELVVSVNVSSLELKRAGFLDRILRALADASLPLSALMLEITEGVLVEHAASQTCYELARYGMRLGIDDFGTGFSSLAYLQRLPIDCMKIDREFLSGEQHTDGLLEAIIKLGQGMGVATIAEGIESSSQLARLRDCGCPMGQGHLFSRPVSPAAIPALLDHGRLVLPPDTLSSDTGRRHQRASPQTRGR